MTEPATPPIEWSSPWYAPWRRAGTRVQAAAETLAGLNAEPSPVRFVPQHELPAGASYESFIRESGCVPTRDNLHDFFNALVWTKFPRAKLALNALQASEIARDGIGARRGPVRDAITVFDENGALLTAPPALWDALRAREWKKAFVELRPLWAQSQLTVFGHALLEALAAPRKELTAHVWCAPAPLAFVDDWLALELTPQRLATKPFMPLPVLGIPGWCGENANFSFYDDSLVFRPARQNEGQQRRAPNPAGT